MRYLNLGVGLILTAWLISGCETTNRDYRGSGRVIDANGYSSSRGANLTARSVAPGEYRVVRGDTLYSIAFRYGLDYRSLAARNGIDAPYNIQVGQILSLNGSMAGRSSRPAPAGSLAQTAVPVAGKPAVRNDANNRPQSAASAPTAASTPIIAGRTRRVGGVTWTWPAQGKIIEGFSKAEHGNKGIDIAAQRGSRVVSAADGQVVYSGNALRGYGNLVIINHNNQYLSAYAHNDSLLVKEGQKVKRGQQIARMGSTDAKSVRLHFEIRSRGQSVNPLGYLPK